MKNKVVFITGASGGLGTSVTRAFLPADENARHLSGLAIPIEGRHG